VAGEGTAVTQLMFNEDGQVITGGVTSLAANVLLHVLLQLPDVTVTVKSYVPPQVAPATTFTVCVFKDPDIVPFPVILQLYAVIPAGAVYILVEPGQTLSFPLMKHVGKGVSVNVTDAVV
jgi:hypothetical protein